MAIIVKSQAALVNDLAKIFGSGQWTNPNFHLTKSNVVIDKNTTLADLLAAEADFDGYAPFTVGYAAVGTIRSGICQICVDLVQATGDTHPNSIYNFFITDSSNTILLGMGYLDDAPYPATAADATIVFSSALVPEGGSIETL